MNINICPRLKKVEQIPGEYRFNGFNLFIIGDGNLFYRSLKIFLPYAAVKLAPLNEANTVISVSRIYSPQSEYFYIRITENGVEIHCSDNMGARNAAATLAQMIRNNNGELILPTAVIEDWPDAKYRAMMFESSGRAWIPMNKLRGYIYEMALCRMNVMIFNFMEDTGCTVPLNSAPRLKGGGSEGLKYTKEEIKEMIAYAADLGITVAPFIEVLSHAADLAVSEGIACPGDSEENMFDVCIGSEKTFEVIERIVKEVAELFPSDVIHIGADEYDMSAVTPKTAYWDKCPHCRKLSEKMGYTTLRELFLYAIERINKIVNNQGKIMMMWNADIHPGHLPMCLDRNIIMHYYRYCSDLGREKLYNLHINGYIDEGFTTINSYYPQTYMDFDDYMSAEKLNSWTYLNDPLVKQANRAKIPGGCCCAWEDHEHYKRTVPAAIPLFADRLWNAEGDPVAYDCNYGKALTRIIFGGKLPEDMNVFAAVGDVLPPLKDNVKIHKDMITADTEELLRIKNALGKAAADGDDTAQSYLDAVKAAIDERLTEKVKEPLKERISFRG